MANREKVIAELKAYINYPEPLCSIAKDAIELLKEQEARKPDCEHAEHDGAGCLGYAGCTQDDEPIKYCKECEAYTGNRTERR